MINILGIKFVELKSSFEDTPSILIAGYNGKIYMGKGTYVSIIINIIKYEYLGFKQKTYKGFNIF